MKGKFSRKLLSLLLAGIITVSGVELPVYAAEESSDAAETESMIVAEETQPDSLAEDTQTSARDELISEKEMFSERESLSETESLTAAELPSETESLSTQTLAAESEDGTEAEEAKEPTATAAQDGRVELSAFAVNPFYEEMYDGEQPERLEELGSHGESDVLLSAADSVDTVEKAAAYIRSKMLARESTIAFNIPAGIVPSGNDAFMKFAQELVDAAAAYSEGCSGQEGDALAWGYTAYSVQASGHTSHYRLTMAFNFKYASTLEQEQQLTAKVNEVMKTLNLSGKSDYDKVRAIHDYICDNVDYDYALKKYSAYDALLNKKAVCQGYAVLFYRMCKEAGLSVRIISGKGNGGAHGWNIVKIGGAARAAGVYYNVDCTWDGQGSNTHHRYFLKSDADFVNHVRDAKYDTAEFRKNFPVSEQSYKIENALNLDNIENSKGKIYAFDGDYDVDNDQMRFTTAKNRSKILVFIQTTCPRSAATVQSIAAKDFSDVDLYVISSERNLGSNQDSKKIIDAIDAFIAKNAPQKGNLQFMYIGGMAWDAYCELANLGENVITPTVVYIDAANKVQHITSGEQTASAIKNNISVYCNGESGGNEGGSTEETVYTVTYELDGGTNHTGNPSAYEEGTDDINLLKPTKEGYDFIGWYTDAELTKAKENITSLDSGNLKLYAKWKETVKIYEYTIAYVLDGGTNHADNPTIYKTGTAAITLKEPTKPDYVFKGWYTDKAQTKEIKEITDANSGDLTLYAKWQENPKDPAGFPQIDMTITEGNLLVGIEGSYETEAKNTILDRLNEIRLEACKEGITLPDGKKLKEADYVPLKWSSEMEAIARLRAAEAAVRLDWNHTRPSGKDWNTVWTTEKKFSMSENLALNGGGIMGAINSFYGEKEELLGNTGKETRHYIYMINPDYKYVGLGSFRLPNTANYPLAIAQEFSMFDGMDETKSNRTGDCVQDIEIAKSEVAKLAFEVQQPLRLDVDQVVKPDLNAEIIITKDKAIIPREITGLVRGGVTWASSDASVAKVDADGTITALKRGTAVISAKSGALSAQITVEVKELVECTVKFDAQGHGTVPKGDHIGGMGAFVEMPKEPSADGYVFGGWHKDKECTKAWDFKKDTLQSDMVLYAKWLKVEEGGLSVQEIGDAYYTGKQCKPSVSVHKGNTLLKANKDYKIEYSDNVNEGTAKVTITGKGEYSGTALEKSFTILKALLNDGKNPAKGVTVRYTEQNVVNPGKTIVPLKSVKLGRTLKKDADYTVSISAKSDSANTPGGEEKKMLEKGIIPQGYSGSFTLKITGMGNYEGTIELPVYVRKADELLKNAKITIGSKVRSVKLEDYADAGTAEVKLAPAYYEQGKYFKYEAGADGKPVLEQDTPLEPGAEQYFFTVKIGDKYLKCGTDFDVIYSDNNKAGKASLTIVGTGSYSGSKTAYFNITGKPLNEKSLRVEGFCAEMDYTGNPLRQNNNVTLYYGLKELEYGKDYTVSYKNNIDKGTAVMTFTAKEGSVYSGSFARKFKIKPIDVETLTQAEGMDNITVPYSKSVNIADRIKLTDNAGQPLVLGKDYTIKYKNCHSAADKNDGRKAPTAIITGKGNYAGNMEVKFTIT